MEYREALRQIRDQQRAEIRQQHAEAVRREQEEKAYRLYQPPQQRHRRGEVRPGEHG